MTRGEILRKAAADIRANGLAKRTFEDDRGRHCGIGAILHASGCVNLRDDAECLKVWLNAALPAGKALSRSLGLRLTFTDTFYEWNNDDERTADEVVRAMECAAEISDHEDAYAAVSA